MYVITLDIDHERLVKTDCLGAVMIG